MNGLDWLPVYGAVVATLALVWNIIRNRPSIKLSDLRLVEWDTGEPQIKFRATDHKLEPVKIDCFGLMMPGGQRFPPFAPPPESASIPGRDYREFTIPIKYIREHFEPEVRSTFRFVFVRDATGKVYRKRIPKNIVREITG